ncbi:hypothetical protein BRC91_00580 [Halobacteriales archaeon QS_4_62_28]|nr:MAG: hypothetical protein BRC91_00580 [Halobacteriales archaeon QS_4_62_28]
MNTRREVISGLACSILGITSGCLAQIGDANNDISPDKLVVEYQSLSDRGQSFVEATFDQHGHTMKWLNRDGDRVYVEYDQSVDRYERAEDPLSLESVDDELTAVYHDQDAYLKKGDKYHVAVVSHGDDGDYRYHVIAKNTDDCEDIIRVDSLSGFERELANVLLNKTEALVSPHEFEPVAKADVYYTGTELQKFKDRFGTPDGNCLEDDDQSVQVEQTESELMDLRTWKLNQADLDQE